MRRFVILGNCSSGSGFFSRQLNRWLQIPVYTDLYDKEPSVSRFVYESYFGKASDSETSPEHYVENVSNPQRFLWNLFYRQLANVPICGMRILYDDIDRLDLIECLEQLIHSHKLKVIHVRRNPIICAAASKQTASQEAAWIDEDTLEDYLVKCERIGGKAKNLVELSGGCELTYRQILLKPDKSIRMVASCLNVPVPPTYMSIPKRPRRQKLFKRRIANLRQLKKNKSLVVLQWLRHSDWW